MVTLFIPSYTKNFLSVNERIVFCSSLRFPSCEDDFFNFSQKTEPCKGLPDRITAKSWSFGNSGWPFDSLNGRESTFKPKGNWMGWSTRWASIVGNQYCVFHLGIIKIPMALPLMIFDMAVLTRLKGGNVYILWIFQLKLKAFTAMQYGSGVQQTYLSSCLLRPVANRSTCGLNWNLSLKILNNLWESINSVLLLKTLDILSSILFPTPGTWLEEI